MALLVLKVKLFVAITSAHPYIVALADILTLNVVSLTILTPAGRVSTGAPFIVHTTTNVALIQLKITSLPGNNTANDGVITGASTGICSIV